MEGSTNSALRFLFFCYVVQSPDVKSSSHVEKAGVVKCLNDLWSADLKIAATTNDRHPSIRKHLRDQKPEADHELDTWHVAKVGLTNTISSGSFFSAGLKLTHTASYASHLLPNVYQCLSSEKFTRPLECLHTVVYIQNPIQPRKRRGR